MMRAKPEGWVGTFHFQAPGARKLLDEIRQASISASEGLGVFAFASAGGVASFMDALGVGAHWTPPKRFHLIIGVDAVTNADALLKVADCVTAAGGSLTAEVFLHAHPASTFHPKFTIFRSPGSICVLTGSGNLTSRGLGEASTSITPPGNWEAFSVQEFGDPEATTHWTDAQDWIAAERSTNRLRPVGDPDVTTRAMANGLVRFTAPVAGGGAKHASVKKAAAAAAGVAIASKWAASTVPSPGHPPVSVPVPAASPATPAASSPSPLDPLATNDLLVKEISSNRPGQADVGKKNLTDFFGYVAGQKKDVVTQYVSLADEVEPTRTTDIFKNASNNFRVELSALQRDPYDIGPDDGRTIVVVARLSPRSFRYTIVPVTSGQYPAVSKIIGPIKAGKGRKMRGQTFPLADLEALWPGAPSNLRPVFAHTPSP